LIQGTLAASRALWAQVLGSRSLELTVCCCSSLLDISKHIEVLWWTKPVVCIAATAVAGKFEEGWWVNGWVGM
jgi:hypothetical protein